MRERTITVGRLNEYIKGVFEDELVLHNLTVEGEVYEYKQSATATFAVLKEGDSILHCTSFSTVEPFAVGDKVALFGYVTFYDRSGKVSFIFKTGRKIGAGDLLAAFNARKEKLQREGWFDRKKSIVSPVRRIAVVTGEAGIVIHDILNTLQRKRRFTDVDVYTAVVQGKSAVPEMIRRLQEADATGYDAVVLARGGGSSDDLSVFNDEDLVRCIAQCATPVISAVGHETDFTLCDFAASVRVGTPSMAGEWISRKNEQFFTRWEAAVYALRSNMQAAVERKTERLYRAATELSYKSEVKRLQAVGKVSHCAARITQGVRAQTQMLCGRILRAGHRLQNEMDNRAVEAENRIRADVAKLEQNSPLRILSLGYAKLYDRNGQTVAYDTVCVGDTVRAVLAEGNLKATVCEKENDTHEIGR